MKNLILLCSLVLFTFSGIAQSKTGTIDADYILAQMPEMTTVQEGMKAYDVELQDNLRSSISSYETKVQEYQTNQESFTEEEKQTIENEIIGLENEIKGFRQKAQVMMQMKRNELTTPLYEKINEAMLEVINEEGFTQIFHAGASALAFSAEGYDITVKVMDKLGLEAKE